MIAEQVIAKLMEVEAFQGRVEGVASLQTLTKTGAKPAQMPCAFVLPTGLTATPNTLSAGLHRQKVDATFGIVFVVDEPDDKSGQRSIPTAEAISIDVIFALAGWLPDDAEDVMMFKSHRLIDLRQGTAYYQLDFSTSFYIRKAK
jgi:hypothetical protein